MVTNFKYILNHTLWVHISYDLMTVLKHCKELAISSCSVLTTKIKLMPKHNKQKLLCVGMFIYTFLSIPKIKRVIQILITLIQVTKGGESFTHCWVEWEINAKLQ